MAFSPDGQWILTFGKDADDDIEDKNLRSVPEQLMLTFGKDADGKSSVVRLWQTPGDLPDDPARIAAWVEAMTGMALDREGAVSEFHTAEWLARREELAKLGGMPIARPSDIPPSLVERINEGRRGDGGSNFGDGRSEATRVNDRAHSRRGSDRAE